MTSARLDSVASRKEFLVNLIFIVAAFYFILSAAMDIPFYHHDIYKYSTGSLHRACTGNQGHMLAIAFGRPVAAYLDCLNNKIGNTLAGINIMRGLSLLLIGLMVSLFSIFLRRLGFLRWTALLMSATLFLLPVVLTTMIMACHTLFVSILLAFSAHYYISKSDGEYNVVNARSILSISFGLLLLIISFFTYPALTAFYLVPASALVLFTPLAKWQSIKSIVVRDLITYAAFSVLYFVAAKELQKSIPVFIPAAYKFNINLHLFEKMQLMLAALPKLWNLDATTVQASFFYAVIAVGCGCGLKAFFDARATSAKSLTQAVTAIFILLLAGNVVYFMMPMVDIPSTRIIFVFQAMMTLILFWSVLKTCELISRKNDKLFFSACLVIFLAAAYFDNLNLTRSVFNDYLELNVIVGALTDTIDKNLPIKRVHIVGSREPNLTGFYPHEDIFSLNSLVSGDDATNMVNTALLRIAHRHTFDLTNCAYKATNGKVSKSEIDCIAATPKENIAVTYSGPEDEIYQSPGTLIIYMGRADPKKGIINFRDFYHIGNNF